MSDAPELGVLEMYDDAIQIADRALQLDPKNAAAWYGKGQILDKFGKKSPKERP